MRRLQIAVFAAIAFAIACDLSDSIVGPKTSDKVAVSKSVGGVPPTNNTPCNVHWAAAVNGDWSDPTKWSPAGVPDSTSSVCIDVAGTYRVYLDPVVDSIPVPVLAISIGGPGATATLEIGSNGGKFNISEGIAIASGGTLWFSGTGSTLTAAGTITNAGFLKVSAPCGGCGGATISADIINTGTLQIINGPTLTLSKVNGQYQNSGNMTYGGFITIPADLGNVTFSQEGGLYSGMFNFDAFTMRSGVFQLKGGKIRTRLNLLPSVILDGANLVIDSSSTDSVTIGVRGRTDMTPTITGNVPALTTLWIGGASNGLKGSVELVGNPVNNGTMRVSRTIDASGGILVTGSGRLTNNGTINNTEANRDTLFYSIDITNNGTINAIGQSSINLEKPNGSYLNSGLIDLQAGISRLTIHSNGDFRNASPGTITNGAVELDGSKFHGVGTLLTTLNANNGGSVSPGDSIGLLTSNQLNIGTGGIVNVELSGNTEITQYDRAVATSLAGFSGTLNIVERNGFQSGVCGQVFDVIHMPSAAAGMFPTINGLNPAPGRMLRAIMVNQTASTPAKIRLVGFDPNSKVCVGPSSVSLTEGGASIQYSIALRDQPTATVIVKPVPDAQVSTVDSAVFTTGNWQTPQVITLSAVDDNVYEGTHSGVVTHTVKSTDLNYNAYAAGSVTATIADNDTPPPVPTTISVTIDSASIQAGHTAQATAVVRDQNGDVMSGESVTWSSDTPSFASVSAGGVVTGVVAGNAVIRATDGSSTGTASITITAPPPPPPVVTTITVSIDSTSLQVPHTAQATATVRDQYGAVMSGQTVSWSSDTPSFATVSAGGVVTAVAQGTATIRASIGGVSGSGFVTITPAPPPPPVPTTVSVAIDSSSLQVGNTAQASATVKDQYGAVMSGQAVSWSSNTPAFASVSNLGVVTGVAEGAAVIKAAIGAVSGTANVTVTAVANTVPVPTTVTVTIDSTSIEIGNTAQAAAVVRDQFGTVMAGQTVLWDVSPSWVASISQTGLITALSWGTAEVRATVGTISGTASISVPFTLTPFSPNPYTVRITFDSTELHVGSQVQAHAVVLDPDGNVYPYVSIKTWRSLTSSVLSVSPTGLVTALRSGLGTIEATTGCIDASCSVTSRVQDPEGSASIYVFTYTPPQPRRIEVSLGAMSVGDVAAATATVYDQFGRVMPNQAVTWTIETPQTLALSLAPCTGPSSCMSVRALAYGWGRVRASLGGLSTTAQSYVVSNYSKAFAGSVSKSQNYTFAISPGCFWTIWADNIQMLADWRSNGQGFVTATFRGEGCRMVPSPWSSSVTFRFDRLSETGTTQLVSNAPQWSGAKFQMEKISKNGMTGYLIFQFFNFGGYSFDIPVKITLQ